MPLQYRRDQVVNIINSVISKVSESQDISRDTICAELQSLKNLLEDLRQQFGAKDLRDNHIPNATDELDQVAGATEAATVTIMNACENILAYSQNIPQDRAQAIEGEVTRIYEACTFQDITGQRITKVIKTLKIIDARLSGILQTSDKNTKPSENATTTPNLLNGPSSAQQGGLSQAEIDRLLE